MDLDAVDQQIVAVLARDARTPNNVLAAQVGVAPSTCLSRVRALRESGTIRGYHADVSPEALGCPLHAMISVRLQADARDQIRAFIERMRTHTCVRNVYFLAGSVDFLLDVVARDTAALRDFVIDELSVRREVASTETNLIFEHVRSEGWLTPGSVPGRRGRR